MKKVICAVFAAVLLASCGCSGWSCKKRYVENSKPTQQLVKNV